MIRTAEPTGASRYAIHACAESQDSGCCKKVRSTSKKTIRHQKYRSQNRLIYCIYTCSRLYPKIVFFNPKIVVQIFPMFQLTTFTAASHVGLVAFLALAAPAAAVWPVAHTGVRAEQFVGRGRQKSSDQWCPKKGSE